MVAHELHVSCSRVTRLQLMSTCYIAAELYHGYNDIIVVYLFASQYCHSTFTNISIVDAQVSNISPDTYSLYGIHYAHVAM